MKSKYPELAVDSVEKIYSLSFTVTEQTTTTKNRFPV